MEVEVRISSNRLVPRGVAEGSVDTWRTQADKSSIVSRKAIRPDFFSKGIIVIRFIVEG
jgi:hypothetical protein